METLRNALGFFEEHGQILVRKTKSGRQEPAMTLHPDWIPKYEASHVPLTLDVYQMVRSLRKAGSGISWKRCRYLVVKGRTGIGSIVWS